MTEQLTLFNLAPTQVIKTVHDPYWDEIVLSPGKVEETGQVSLFYEDTQDPPDPDDYPTIEAYESAWTLWETQHPDLVPLVKGMSDIPTLPEHNHCVLEELPKIPLPTLPEHCNQWVEKYFVTRAGTKHWYFRYCYYDRGKIHHYHIPGGNVRSPIAQGKKEEVEIAIADGETPQEIQKIIRAS